MMGGKGESSKNSRQTDSKSAPELTDRWKKKEGKEIQGGEDRERGGKTDKKKKG